MMDPTDRDLSAECIVAVLGIPAALAKKPKPPSEAELARATKLPNTISSRVRELLALARPTSEMPLAQPPDYMETQEALVERADGDDLAEMIGPVPMDLQPSVSMVWSRGIAYLAGILPRRTEQLLTGPKLHEPSAGEWAEFGWSWRLARDPLDSIGLLSDGMLIGPEVDHLKAMWPALHAAIGASILEEMAKLVAKSDDWSPPWWLHKQLCTFAGISSVSDTLRQDLEQALQQNTQANAQRRISAVQGQAQGLQTASQKLEAR